ncbi:hypothetical protein J2T38_000724 [Neisseria perflava]|uniref:hypothetical protein n=1 Tax=Neisseria perflava TaxID=33053 RepID=UPI00209DC76D|nr:hypothetical protein [Neisseria perflava]MCP1771917.1 hypothetical protein [Neisseria perflava]
MSKNHKLLLVGTLLLVFAVIKIAMLGWWAQQQPTAQSAECNVRQGCALPDGIQVKFSERITANAPFDIVLDSVPDTVQSVTVSFTMKDMDMGFNRYALKREADGRWAARQIRLPLCIERRNDYLADINIGGKVFQTAFTTE